LAREKIQRFLSTVNQGLRIAQRRLSAERQQLQVVATHLALLEDAIAQLEGGAMDLKAQEIRALQGGIGSSGSAGGS
jgi:hypothetical protein